jgi:hypothetical protein
MILKLAVPSETPIESLLHELNEAGREFEVTADLREFHD